MRVHAGCCGFVLAVLLTNAPAHAAWCAQYRPGGTNCGFSTFAQCQASISGIGGFCSQSGEDDARPAERTRQRAAPPQKPKSKAVTRPPDRPASTAAPATSKPPGAIARAATAAMQNPAGFAAARKLILDGQHEAGLKAMLALGADAHPDVASNIGWAHHKLGRPEEAKSWYEKALAADPRHLQTLAYEGALRAEQGDLGGARLDLAKIRLVCGNTRCSEYVGLAGLIATKTR